MRRPANIEWVYRTFEKIRAAMPDVAIRTTFIVGYPGETEEEFEGLLKFVRDLQFDRVGAFQYSFEPGTPSAELADQVADDVKQDRYERLMEMQQSISLQRNQTARGPHARRADRRAGRWVDAGPLVPRCAGDRRHGDSGRHRARGPIRAGEDRWRVDV